MKILVKIFSVTTGYIPLDQNNQIHNDVVAGIFIRIVYISLLKWFSGDSY